MGKRVHDLLNIRIMRPKNAGNLMHIIFDIPTSLFIYMKGAAYRTHKFSAAYFSDGDFPICRAENGISGDKDIRARSNDILGVVDRYPAVDLDYA